MINKMNTGISISSDKVLFDLPPISRQAMVYQYAIIPIILRAVDNDKHYKDVINKDGEIIRYGINAYGQEITTGVVVNE